MFRALTIPNGNDTPVLILSPDMCTANMGAMRTAHNNGVSMVSSQPSEIQVEDRGCSCTDSTKTYDLLKRQVAVGSQVSENIFPKKVFMLPTSSQVSHETFQPETKSLSTEALPNLKTVVTGKVFSLLIKWNC